MTIELAVHNRCAPAVAEMLPVRDAMAMIARINERRHEQLKFEAALHGAKLR